MMMRRLSSVTLVSLLLLQTLALNYLPEAEAASARGGASDDFTISSIELGNSSFQPEIWIQPNGEVTDYLLQNDLVEVVITVFKDGPVTGTQKQTDAQLEVVHPIGFVIETFTWTTELLAGGQEEEHKLTWNPQQAHSILNTSTNELTGGLILRASVNFTEDDRNDNDVMEKQVPIAVYKDKMDTEPSSTTPSFHSGKYPIGGGDATSRYGSWYIDNGQTDGNSAVGDDHWRMINEADNDYPGSSFDRLVHSFYWPQEDTSCNGQAYDAGLSTYYGINVCRQLFQSQNYISTQVHLQAWGVMGAGDSAYLEFWNGNGNFTDPLQSVHWDVAEINPSPYSGEWKNIS